VFVDEQTSDFPSFNPHLVLEPLELWNDWNGEAYG
jgi:hypothetical protein